MQLITVQITCTYKNTPEKCMKICTTQKFPTMITCLYVRIVWVRIMYTYCVSVCRGSVYMQYVCRCNKGQCVGVHSFMYDVHTCIQCCAPPKGLVKGQHKRRQDRVKRLPMYPVITRIMIAFFPNPRSRDQVRVRCVRACNIAWDQDANQCSVHVACRDGTKNGR